MQTRRNLWKQLHSSEPEWNHTAYQLQHQKHITDNWKKHLFIWNNQYVQHVLSVKHTWIGTCQRTFAHVNDWYKKKKNVLSALKRGHCGDTRFLLDARVLWVVLNMLLCCSGMDRCLFTVPSQKSPPPSP